MMPTKLNFRTYYDDIYHVIPGLADFPALSNTFEAIADTQNDPNGEHCFIYEVLCSVTRSFTSRKLRNNDEERATVCGAPEV